MLPRNGDAHFPLRLLDIRRMDLHSAGWETFFVKRAAEDWLRDARLNLGQYSLAWPQLFLSTDC